MYNPRGNKLCSAKEIMYRHNIHKKHLQDMKHRVDTKAPPQLQHVQLKAKKRYLDGHKTQLIERDNHNLMEKIFDIMHTERNQPGQEEVSYLPGVKLDKFCRPLTDHFVSNSRRFMHGETNGRKSIHTSAFKKAYAQQVRENVVMARRIHYSKTSIPMKKYAEDYDMRLKHIRANCSKNNTIGHLDVKNKNRTMTSMPPSEYAHKLIAKRNDNYPRPHFNTNTNSHRGEEGCEGNERLGNEFDIIHQTVEGLKDMHLWGSILTLYNFLRQSKLTVSLMMKRGDKKAMKTYNRKVSQQNLHSKFLSLGLHTLSVKQTRQIFEYMDKNDSNFVDMVELDNLMMLVHKYHLMMDKEVKSDETKKLTEREIEQQWRADMQRKENEESKKKKTKRIYKIQKLEENSLQWIEATYLYFEDSKKFGAYNFASRLSQYIRKNHFELSSILFRELGIDTEVETGAGVDQRSLTQALTELKDRTGIRVCDEDISRFIEFIAHKPDGRGSAFGTANSFLDELDTIIRFHESYLKISRKKVGNTSNNKVVEFYVGEAWERGALKCMVYLDFCLGFDKTIKSIFSNVTRSQSNRIAATELEHFFKGKIDISLNSIKHLVGYSDFDKEQLIDLEELQYIIRKFNDYMKYKITGNIKFKSSADEEISTLIDSCKKSKMGGANKFNTKKYDEFVKFAQASGAFAGISKLEAYLQREITNIRSLLDVDEADEEFSISVRTLTSMNDFHQIGLSESELMDMYMFHIKEHKNEVPLKEFENSLDSYRKFIFSKKLEF